MKSAFFVQRQGLQRVGISSIRYEASRRCGQWKSAQAIGDLPGCHYAEVNLVVRLGKDISCGDDNLGLFNAIQRNVHVSRRTFTGHSLQKPPVYREAEARRRRPGSRMYLRPVQSAGASCKAGSRDESLRWDDCADRVG